MPHTFLTILATVSIAPACNSYSSASETNGITAISNMTATRAAHTATLLPDGNILIAGGFGNGQSRLAKAELFDPAQKTFASIGNMNASRSGHTATLLPKGKVLICGWL